MSKAEAFEVKFAGNRSINVEVNFSKGDAIKVPVNINSMDTDKLAQNIAEKLDLSPVAKEETTQDILSAVNGIATSMYKGVPVVAQTTDATIAPNVWNVWGEVTSLTITKGADINGVVNNYMVRFTALEDASVTFDGFSLSWFGGEAPTWAAGNTYEISIVDNIALWAEIEPAA